MSLGKILDQSTLMDIRIDGDLSDDQINEMLKNEFKILKSMNYDYDVCDTGLIYYNNEIVYDYDEKLKNNFDNIRFLVKLRECL